MSRRLNFCVLMVFFLSVLSVFTPAVAEPTSTSSLPSSSPPEPAVDQLQEPLFKPFIERYVLDELKALRVEQAQTKNELLQQIVDREHHSVDRAVAYATDTVTYFFYLIAAATSVLVIVGWNSIRDIKERVHGIAEAEISRIVSEYETRLENIEKQLRQKSRSIEENREEIELTQDVQSLWLRAQQDASPTNKIKVYDEILKLKPYDCEALSYKADAVLELDEPQWAINLCLQSLKGDPQNAHALYQLACAYAVMSEFDEALQYLQKAIELQPSYRDEVHYDVAMSELITQPACQELLGFKTTQSDESDESSTSSSAGTQ